MTYLPSVVRAEYRGGFRIQLTFSDGSDATIDFGQWLDGPIFEPLKDPSYFRRFLLTAVRWCGRTVRTSRRKRSTMRCKPRGLTRRCSRRRRRKRSAAAERQRSAGRNP